MKKLTKYFICIIIFLLLGIISKQNIEYKEKIHQKLYEETISFTSFENLYNKYLGGIFPIENINNQINISGTYRFMLYNFSVHFNLFNTIRMK